MKPARWIWRLQLVWLLAGSAIAQPAPAPPINNSPTNPPTARIFAPDDGAAFPAATDIRILANATPHGAPQAPDPVVMEIFADTNRLGVMTNFMQSGPLPPRNANGPARPFVTTPGVLLNNFVWSNAPAGDYILTVKATNTNGLSVVSEPVHISVRAAP